MTRKEKIIDISMLLGTAIAIITALFAGFAKECDELRGSTFRLHIIANSDSIRDQQIKYALRDYIISDLGGIFSSCSSKDETKALAERNLGYIEQRANEFLAEKGIEQTARCSVENAEFPTRVYEDFTLPAGKYDALRVVIGAGEGKNWWCVLYPDVCLRAVSIQKSVLPQRTLYESNKRASRMTADSLRAERGQTEYRFALYDFIRSLFGK